MAHTLLLADDSVTIQRVIELTFADEDVQVVAVSDGDQAVARLDSAPPDIVLADIGMPGRDGYEVARYVKQSPRLAHIPVVLLTGAFEPVDQARAAEVGCDGVLAKPFEPQMVIARVKELLSSQSHRAAAEVPVVAPAPAAVDVTGTAIDGAGASHGDFLHGAEAPIVAQQVHDSAVLADKAAESVQPGEQGAAQLPDLDDYFDQLDAAFANRAAQTFRPADDVPLSYASPESAFEHPPAPATPAPDVAPPVHVPVAEAPPAATVQEPRPTPTPVPTPAPPSAAALVASAPRPIERAPERGPAAPLRTTPLPHLSEAFAALLAAETQEELPAERPAWPAGASAPIEVSDELVDRIARRVLEQMSDRLVRETVAETVSAVAERLVREEIEKIKAAIK